MGWKVCDPQGRTKKKIVWKDIVPTLRKETHGNLPLVAYMPTNGTSTQHKFTKKDLKMKLTKETSEKSQQKKYQTTTYLPQGFLAKLSRWLEKGEGLKILEGLCSLKLLVSPNKSNHAFYSLKTLKGYYHTTKAKHLELSSIRWMNWGMTANGKCLTAKTSVSPKTGNECSLSDILEEQVDQRYFLSEEATERIMPRVSYTIDSNYWKGTNLKQYKEKKRRQLVSDD